MDDDDYDYDEEREAAHLAQLLEDVDANDDNNTRFSIHEKAQDNALVLQARGGSGLWTQTATQQKTERINKILAASLISVYLALRRIMAGESQNKDLQVYLTSVSAGMQQMISQPVFRLHAVCCCT